MTDKVGSHLMLLAVCGTLAGGVPIAAQGAPLLDVVQVAAGGQHTCAVTTGGRVLCWGNNNFGQLGNPAPGEQVFAVSVTDLEGVKTVVTGEHHTCALTTVGGVKCWGSGILLGDGSTTNRSTPTDVIGLSSGVVALSAGGWHTCAAMQNGRVMCWGLNQYGQIGDGTTTTRSTPVNVGGLGSGPWHRVAVGLYHTCAHTSTTPGGIAKCWGWNRDGQLGDGTTTDRLSPVDVLTVGSKVASIAAGPLHT